MLARIFARTCFLMAFRYNLTFYVFAYLTCVYLTRLFFTLDSPDFFSCNTFDPVLLFCSRYTNLHLFPVYFTAHKTCRARCSFLVQTSQLTWTHCFFTLIIFLTAVFPVTLLAYYLLKNTLNLIIVFVKT